LDSQVKGDEKSLAFLRPFWLCQGGLAYVSDLGEASLPIQRSVEGAREKALTMDDRYHISDVPRAKEIYMVAGWHQWADAGEVSSKLPQYLIELTGATKIGEIKPARYYLFQVPGTYDLLRPKIKLDDGYRRTFQVRRNDFYYTGDESKGLVIFVGHEPHLMMRDYGEAFFDAVEELGVKRIVVTAGVHGPVPYDKDRQISCVYSLPKMKQELRDYAVRFSNYEGGSSIGTYLVHVAEEREIEFMAMYAMVPFYDLGQLAMRFTGIQVEEDFRAWYEMLRRLSHMFGLSLDLTNLERKSRQLGAIIEAQIAEVDKKVPSLKIKEQIEELTQDFEETSFVPLSEMWRRELKDLLGDDDAE
jgi:proteasome assembly chaperone (PAC2) family protein